MPKFLVIRFSSIGDIVLTSPVVRCLSTQIPDAEIHYLTKASFRPLTEHHPAIRKVHTITHSVSEVIPALEAEQFDHIVDLHHNLRSWQVKRALRVPSTSFPKLNFEKWLLVNAGINRLPDEHVVDRYFRTVKDLGVRNDGRGLDFFLGEKAEELLARAGVSLPQDYIAVVTGAKFGTKQMPPERMADLLRRVQAPLVLLGGTGEKKKAAELNAALGNTAQDLSGKTDLLTSAAIVQLARKILTHDTGLMHIAAAFKKEIISVWGSTVPAFGMYPYLSGTGKKGEGHLFEVKSLPCRPCSKLGFEQCPKGHFRCMYDQDITAIATALNR
ncbi:MAG: glycosyltransferase family 9 protein [Bacteroidia bacterium]|nr:glycosyltransferase family 9 protein [Bacteroidia bacterium]